jgi:hypothetical protein
MTTCSSWIQRISIRRLADRSREFFRAPRRCDQGCVRPLSKGAERSHKCDRNVCKESKPVRRFEQHQLRGNNRRRQRTRARWRSLRCARSADGTGAGDGNRIYRWRAVIICKSNGCEQSGLLRAIYVRKTPSHQPTPANAPRRQAPKRGGGLFFSDSSLSVS